VIFTAEEQAHLAHIMSTYRGNGQELENALGALCLGKMYGWKVIRVMHAPASYAKYQDILDVRFNEWCEETTSLTHRHRGYQLAQKAKSFWQLMRGMETPPEGFKELKKEFA
jgi:hypothetical protein